MNCHSASGFKLLTVTDGIDAGLEVGTTVSVWDLARGGRCFVGTGGGSLLDRGDTQTEGMRGTHSTRYLASLAGMLPYASTTIYQSGVSFVSTNCKTHFKGNCIYILHQSINQSTKMSD